jgi:hypothetical protein
MKSLLQPTTRGEIEPRIARLSATDEQPLGVIGID